MTEKSGKRRFLGKAKRIVKKRKPIDYHRLPSSNLHVSEEGFPRKGHISPRTRLPTLGEVEGDKEAT